MAIITLKTITFFITPYLIIYKYKGEEKKKNLGFSLEHHSFIPTPALSGSGMRVLSQPRTLAAPLGLLFVNRVQKYIKILR
jgi:hypothetical protein